mmetsp:Transcript_3432/g.6475  ORF Transcript_3432/g.6475 Transcript_3432/m.6475 type:complete len:260 (+) Transcript_3432:2621-3400(+)
MTLALLDIDIDIDTNHGITIQYILHFLDSSISFVYFGNGIGCKSHGCYTTTSSRSHIPIVTPNEQRLSQQPRVSSSSIALIPCLSLENYNNDKIYNVPHSKHLPFLEPKAEADATSTTSSTMHPAADHWRHSSRFAESPTKEPFQISLKSTNTARVKTGVGKDIASLLIDSFPAASSGTTAHPAATPGDQDSLSISPSIFDDTYTTEESQELLENQENDDCFVKATDPLAVFLDEMGDGFEDDINFGTSTGFGNYFAAI